MQAKKTLDAIDKTIQDDADSGFRKHLGASIIGAYCARQIWYSFRWSRKATFESRLLRLFQRGHREESVFGDYLRRIGCEVWLEEAGRQFKCADVNGHFGGSMDGVARGIPDVPIDTNCLLEFKTHGDKSFKTLVKDGLLKSKWQHFIQMQVYMFKFGFEYAAYFAVNKNDDSLFIEIVRLDKKVAEDAINRARDIIYAETAPKKISENAGFYKCKWCDFSDICHFPKGQAEKNCRTCKHSFPVKDGKWDCASKACEIDSELMLTGCENHDFIDSFKGC